MFWVLCAFLPCTDISEWLLYAMVILYKFSFILYISLKPLSSFSDKCTKASEVKQTGSRCVWCWSSFRRVKWESHGFPFPKFRIHNFHYLNVIMVYPCELYMEITICLSQISHMFIITNLWSNTLYKDVLLCFE